MIPALQEAYIQAVEKAVASTVNVGSAVGPWGPQGRRWPRRGVGSGVVYDASGHILTNSHVIGEAERILVTTGDGRSFEGRLVGDDEETDVAVIKVESTDLMPAEFADSEKLRVGQPVLAIGNPLGLAGGPTVTSGVISSLRRSLRRDWFPYGDGLKVIQTDAAVNPGNSGGALVDLEGRVVAITAATMPWAEGIGFAIPINEARRIADQLITHGSIPRPWLGVAGYDLNRRVAHQYGLSTSRGVLVTEVKPESPAAEAGIHVGDVLTSIGDKSLEDLGDLLEALRQAKIGDGVVIEVDRNGRKVHAQVRLGTRPF